MSEKRRGLGRGLGALIPTSSEGKRPVDVFFPSAPVSDGDTHGKESIADVTAAPGVDPVQGSGAETAVATLNDTPGPADVIGVVSLSEQDLAELSALEEAQTDEAARAEQPFIAGEAAATDARGAATDAAVRDSGATVSRETSGAAVGEDESTSSSASTDPLDAELQWIGGAGDDLVPVPGARFAEIPVESIRPNPRQPRTVFDDSDLEELVGSIREIGVLQPIVVRPVPGENGSYELIMGERRWRATQAAGMSAIPAIVRETDDADLLRDALLENLHRSALNPLEEAAAYRQLLDDFGCTHEELAERISRSRPQISNTLRLLRLPPLVQRRVAAGVLSAGHARALLGLTDGGEIERLAQRIVAEGLSVRATEEIVAMGGLDQERRQARTPRAGQRSAAIDELATRLSDRFETRVKVDLGKNKGRLTVEFASVEDLNRILDVMAPEDPGLLRQ
ncbi:ParB/RepB/Spo0J family partition protein [Cellulosimicrobium sp. Marseille-Q4280]|uniref:ParB/RepB/Spo0J family partition protein n=1 Tax=Cellulosimicrobium sp. Marseille-Q4280 TaxID=2937992 RepID=UPI00203E5F19|nr:ParB/RepB/Spo0J family partition protein [Cellulosimicrobium sp. Marseille-Q4280]